jgi:hypothetical protein
MNYAGSRVARICESVLDQVSARVREPWAPVAVRIRFSGESCGFRNDPVSRRFSERGIGGTGAARVQGSFDSAVPSLCEGTAPLRMTEALRIGLDLSRVP